MPSRLAAIAAAVLLLLGLGGAANAGPQSTWIASWGTAPASGVPNTDNGYPNYSIRNIVHLSLGGTAVRVHLSNAFGRSPLVIGHATVALAQRPTAADAVPGTLNELTFGHEPTIIIPAGAEAVSDPVPMTVPDEADLLVTTFVPTPSGPVTYHPAAQQTSFYATDGDHAADESGASFPLTTAAWHYVTGVDVRAPAARGSVVTLGDSITDGVRSTPNANRRWPDFLADRLLAQPRSRRMGVLNAGISANRLLLDGGTPLGGSGVTAGVNALARLDRDVLSRPGATTLIVVEGINDIQQTPNQTDPAPIIAALRQIIERAHARGFKVVGGTLTPFKGWRVHNETLESVRQSVNAFIRSGAFDAVADFDAALADPEDPLRMWPPYDSGDHLHPSDAGYQAMANAIPLSALAH
ncbi:SGNH/GDSL hydrolase family protein [Nonomuraea africana]|uniref:Lysophospholipase L1-like esterase n=1 Tax=Nonomuraea africana TaxID=46171 RepID=A0ABR9KC14_9ACTN|nr:SGNH/GDSL hydrolase family protein [Nonomuraea africana]MBE1559550.1 lysophospholipase L1-like esterase [Nonomuraea africana]